MFTVCSVILTHNIVMVDHHNSGSSPEKIAVFIFQLEEVGKCCGYWLLTEADTEHLINKQSFNRWSISSPSTDLCMRKLIAICLLLFSCSPICKDKSRPGPLWEASSVSHGLSIFQMIAWSEGRLFPVVLGKELVVGSRCVLKAGVWAAWVCLSPCWPADCSWDCSWVLWVPMDCLMLPNSSFR